MLSGPRAIQIHRSCFPTTSGEILRVSFFCSSFSRLADLHRRSEADNMCLRCVQESYPYRAAPAPREFVFFRGTLRATSEATTSFALGCLPHGTRSGGPSSPGFARCCISCTAILLSSGDQAVSSTSRFSIGHVMSIWVSGTRGRRTIIHHLHNLLRQLEAGDCGHAQAEHSLQVPPAGGCSWMEICGVAERGHAPTR